MQYTLVSIKLQHIGVYISMRDIIIGLNTKISCKFKWSDILIYVIVYIRIVDN